jgi:hypothetical protein
MVRDRVVCIAPFLRLEGRFQVKSDVSAETSARVFALQYEASDDALQTGANQHGVASQKLFSIRKEQASCEVNRPGFAGDSPV